jgi:hypothetical protein
MTGFVTTAIVGFVTALSSLYTQDFQGVIIGSVALSIGVSGALLEQHKNA